MTVSAGDLVVKKFDNSTDVTYTLLAASAGDKIPAIWRQNSAPGTNGQKPTFTMASRSAGNGSARALDFVFQYPSVYTDTTGVTRVRSKCQVKSTAVLPLDATDTDIQEMAAQSMHLMAHAGVIAAIVSGYAAT